MKRTCSTLFLTLLLSMVEINAWADESGSRTRTINVETAGTLRDLIPREELYTIDNLTLTGEINGQDFSTLRWMAGKNTEYKDGSHLYNPIFNVFRNTDGKLTSLDLSGVKIVAGGVYMDWDDGDNDFFYTLSNDNEIPPHVFHGCSRLTSIKIPESVNIIGSDAFAGTAWYENQPNGLVYIGNVAYAYKGEMPANTKLTIKEGTLGIACSAFCDQPNLISIEIPNSVTAIGGITEYASMFWYINDNDMGMAYHGAFAGCTGLTSVKLPESVQFIGCYSFLGCTGLTSISIPESVKTIGVKAFGSCTGLTKIDIPQSVNEIGRGAFAGCTGLSSIVIPNGVTSIQYDLFKDCSSLTSITIPSSITSISYYSAFYGCSSLKDLYCYAENVPKEEGFDATFSNPENITLHVPIGSVDAYKAASPWNELKDIVAIGTQISISKSGKTTLTSSQALDFSGFEDLKAYVATGYEEDGTIWLTRIKQVPAGTPVLIKGEADHTYEVPALSKCVAYFENMFMGSADEDVIISATSSDGKYKNFYMSGGTFKPAPDNYTLKAGKCYLQVPANFNEAKAGADLKVKIAESGKSSYAPPVDIDLTNVEGLKAYAATGYDAASQTIWLTRIFKIQAGEGVLLKGEANNIYTLPAAEIQAYYGNMFVGNIDINITIGETSEDGKWTNYYLAGGSFKKVSGNRNISANKSYLQLPTSLLVSSARGRQAGIDEWLMEELETEIMLLGSIGGDDDGTTKIDAIRQNNTQPDVYYNLQGQRIETPKMGIYIHNGRKVVIK